PFCSGALPVRSPLRRAGWHGPVGDRTPVRAANRNVGTTDKAMRPAIEIPIGVEVVDRGAPSAGGDERIEAFAFEEQRDVGAALVGVVLADDTGLRLGVVGLADA